MTIGTRLFTWWKGDFVGTDQFGNRYYKEKNPPARRREKRWVIYDGEVEASRVPAEWHAWLHYTIDEPPLGERKRYAWEKEHEPNLTGSAAAYRPAGHVFAGGRRAQGTGDYEPWQPS